MGDVVWGGTSVMQENIDGRVDEDLSFIDR